MLEPPKELFRTAIVGVNVFTTEVGLTPRIGVAGFDNPMRDAKTEDVIRNIGQVGKKNIFQKKILSLRAIV